MRAYLGEHPSAKVWFDFGNEDRAIMRRWLPMIEKGRPPKDATMVDLDTISTASTKVRYQEMGRALGVEVNTLSLPWELPRSLLATTKADYPNIGTHIALEPWSGGCAVTRSLPDDVVWGLAGQREFPTILVHHEPVGAFAGLPNNLSGNLPLDQLFAVVSLSRATVSIDTGVAWVAASMGKPTVVAFTHIDPAHRVLPQDNIAVVTPGELPCGPCGDFAWPPKCPDGGLARCARQITAAAILDALRGIV